MNEKFSRVIGGHLLCVAGHAAREQLKVTNATKSGMQVSK